MKGNYEIYLRVAKETLEHVEYLTPGDRTKIERGIYDLEYGHSLLKSDDPAKLRLAASLLMTGAATIMAGCGVSDSEAEYWRRQRCAKGGKGKKEKRKKNQAATEAWRSYARTLEAANTETTITALADSLLIDEKRPVATPSNSQTLQKFLGNARRERLIAGDAKPIRLVHSA